MKKTTITLPDDLAYLVSLEAERRETSLSDVIRQLVLERLGGSTGSPREIPWAGLFEDPQMTPGSRIRELLAERWADDIDRDRG